MPVQVVLANAQSASGLPNGEQLIRLGGLHERGRAQTGKSSASHLLDFPQEPWEFFGWQLPSYSEHKLEFLTQIPLNSSRTVPVQSS